jgi:hypothetical protein
MTPFRLVNTDVSEKLTVSIFLDSNPKRIFGMTLKIIHLAMNYQTGGWNRSLSKIVTL